MKLLSPSLLVFVLSTSAFSSNKKSMHLPNCKMLEIAEEQVQCDAMKKRLTDSSVILKDIYAEMESLLVDRFFVAPDLCEKDSGIQKINCHAASEALNEGVSISFLEAFIEKTRKQDPSFLINVKIEDADYSVVQHWSKPLKTWWSTKSQEEKKELLIVRRLYPHLFRSAIFGNPKLMDPRYNEFRSSSHDLENPTKEIVNLRNAAIPEIKQFMEEDKQAIGWELECWLTHMKMSREDNLILKSIHGEKDKNGNWNKWYDTYGMPLFKSEEKTRVGETGHFLPTVQTVFESRYSDSAQPYIEIISAPLTNSDSQKFTNQSIKHTMVMIPEILRIHGKLSFNEWLSKIQEQTPDLSWKEKLSTWTAKRFQNPSVLSADEREELAKSTKEDFLNNEMYFSPAQTYCIVQANTDVFLEQFYTAPYLIQSMAYEHNYSNRDLYALARKWAHREINRIAYEANSARAAEQFLNDTDPRNYVAGIMTIALYQAMIRSAILQKNWSMEKNSILQLMKIPITDLARLKGLTDDERWALLELNKQFQERNWEDLDSEDQKGLATLMNELSYRPVERKIVEDQFVKLKEFMANWFLNNTFENRYPSDVYSDDGSVLFYGREIEDQCFPNDDGTCALPLELGKPLPAFEKEGRTGVVVETRHSNAPFNYAYFWETEPKCCDFRGKYWLNANEEKAEL